MLNNVSLVGRLTKDPEVRTIGTEGTQVCNFTVAVNRPFKDENGEKVADFIQCQAWKKQAEFIGKYLVKGQLVALTGSIHTRTYEKADQTTAYVTEVNVDQIQSLEKREGSEPVETEASIKAEWKKEWDEKSISLKGLAKDKLKKDLEAKYQPRINALAKSSVEVTKEDLPF